MQAFAIAYKNSLIIKVAFSRGWRGGRVCFGSCVWYPSDQRTYNPTVPAQVHIRESSYRNSKLCSLCLNIRHQATWLTFQHMVCICQICLKLCLKALNVED